VSAGSDGALSGKGRGKPIRLSGVTKGWGGAPAVDGIDVTVPAGSFAVLLGPSGCGKSTTLRIIAGLEAADQGEVSIGGEDVTRRPPAERDLAMVFQSYALFPHLSVAENILFGLKVRRVSRADRERRLERAAALLGLEAYLGRKPSQLSGGQQQRVALGRAIIAEKPVCLMDEPLSNLDAKLRQDMRVEIRALQRKLGFTMVYVTHDQVEAISMADQVVLLNAGRVEQAATPHEIYERPSSPFVARFIGTPPMNLVPGAALAASTPGLLGAASLPDPEQLLIGIRPEDVRVDTGSGLPASVAGIEYLGADTLVDCLLDGQRIVARTGGARDLRVGAAVTLGWDAEALHLFERASGRRRDDLRELVRSAQGPQDGPRRGPGTLSMAERKTGSTEEAEGPS